MNDYKKSLLRVVQGIIIGGGAILPGVSGGVLCVLFGIYRPMMELFAHPVQALKRNLPLFIPVGIGWVAGFLIFAKALDFIFSKYELYAVCLFIGLIGGTIPALYRDAGKEGRTKGSFASMAVAFIVLLGILSWVRFGGLKGGISPNTGWYLFCGVLWGLSLVVPGMSSSSILISLGLYQPMTAGIAALDLSVILPWLGGLVAAALGAGRIINHLFETRGSQASHAVVGIVAASTVAIIPLQYGSPAAGGICLICFAGGLALALVMDRLGMNKQ